jgi:intein/homing endonuclease
VQFDTTINEWHTCPEDGRINASNPCVTGDTLVSTADGWIRIDQLLARPFRVTGSDGRLHEVKPAFKTGAKPVYRLRTKAGFEVKLTGDHRVLTANRGDVPALELEDDDRIVVFGQPISTDEQEGGAVAVLNATATRVRASAAKLSGSEDTLESLDYLGVEDVYDLTEPDTSHFVANGIVVHNCSEYLFLDDTACFAPETRISTPGGLRTVEELYQAQLRGDGVFVTTDLYSEHDHRRLTAHRPAFVTKVGEREVFRVTLKDGRIIRATAAARRSRSPRPARKSSGGRCSAG